MQPGSYYLGIQLTEYLLIALEFVTHRLGPGTCHLEVKFIDYLLTSLEFITYQNGQVLETRNTWRRSDGNGTLWEELLSLLQLQVDFSRYRWFVKNFQKSG